MIKNHQFALHLIRESTVIPNYLFHEALGACRYGNVLHDMQKQISEFNRKHGRGIDERPIGLGGFGGFGGGGGGIMGSLLNMAMQELSGGGVGGAGRTRGQTPQMSASEVFDFNSRISM